MSVVSASFGIAMVEKTDPKLAESMRKSAAEYTRSKEEDDTWLDYVPLTAVLLADITQKK